MTEKPISILVIAHSKYIDEQSDPIHEKFVWSYEITIKNESDSIVQLLNRFWRVTDTTGKIEEIQGAGVVGLQPLIKPGRRFTYVSYCQLITPQGTMEGHYEMQDLDEQHFLVKIPKFILSAPSPITLANRSKLH